MNVNKTLDLAPSSIARLAKVAEEARFLWKTSEIQMMKLSAMLHLKCKAENPDMTVADLKAKIEGNEDVYKKRMEILAKESEYKKDCIEVEKWVNAFTSARKKASLQIEEMRSLNDVVTKKGEKR